MRKLLLIALILIATPLYARQIPAHARFGEVQEVSSNTVRIDKITYQRAPGLRIYSTSNTLMFLHQLPVDSKIAYQIDHRGDLSQIWILTAEETPSKSFFSWFGF